MPRLTCNQFIALSGLGAAEVLMSVHRKVLSECWACGVSVSACFVNSVGVLT